MKRIMLLVLTVLIVAANCTTVYASETDYVIDNDGERLATPKTYLVKGVITYLGENGGNLYEPKDIFIDKEDYIYIADTGNNRVVKLDPEGNYVRSYTGSDSLLSPQGVYCTEFGSIFVADTGNQRVANIDEETDLVVEEFTKPDSELLEDSSDFSVNKVSISKQGLLYVMKGQRFMTIDANNDFKGFVGANNLAFSLKRTLIRMFATEEQKSRLEMEEAPPYNNFMIADSGMIYAVASTESAKIKKLNASGANLYPTDYITETIYDEDGFTVEPDYVDIAVDSQEIITVLESNTGHVYQYDQDGNLLTIFGGKGNKKGYFQNPCSLAVNSKGEIYVLDTSTGYIHIFTPSSFMEHIKSAIYHYAEGEYTLAYDEWMSVIEIDANYPVANMGLGQVLYKMDEPEQAMRYFEIAKEQQNYGKAFEDYRYAYIKTHFFQVVLVATVVLIVVIMMIFFVSKKAKKYIHDYHYGPDEEMSK